MAAAAAAETRTAVPTLPANVQEGSGQPPVEDLYEVVEPPTNTTTITNVAINVTAAEAVAEAEAEGAAARAAAAAEGAARRQREQEVPVEKWASTPTTEVGRGTTARLAATTTPRFGPGAPTPVYGNLERPVMAPGNGAVPRRPLWPEES